MTNAEMNLEEVIHSLFDSVMGEENDRFNVEKIHVPVTKNALTELYIELSRHAMELLRIASGVAIIKGQQVVTLSDTIQAINMKNRGVETVLPPVVHEW